jgi:hypothetical protein
MAHVKLLLELEGSIEELSKQVALLLRSGLVNELRPLGPTEDAGEWQNCAVDLGSPDRIQALT